MANDGENEQQIFFSVILISYKHDDFVLDALKSIKYQDFDPTGYELIIICKANSGVKIIVGDLNLECNVKFVIDDDYKIGPKFLEALKMAQSEWIVVIDDDDVWMPKKLEVLYQLITKHPKAVYLHNDKFTVDEHFHYDDIRSPKIIESVSPFPTSEDLIIRSFRDNCEHNGSSIAFSDTIVNEKLDSLKLLEGGLDTFLYVSAIESAGELICTKERLTLFRVISKNNQNDHSKNLLNNLRRQLQSYEVVRNMKLTNHFTQWLIDWRIMYNRLKINLIEETKIERKNRFEFLLESIRNKFFITKEGLYFEFLFVLQFISERVAKCTYKLATNVHSKR